MPQGRYVYGEPVATDPAHSRMGLGKATVLEGIRRCAPWARWKLLSAQTSPFILRSGLKWCMSARAGAPPHSMGEGAQSPDQTL